MNTPNPAPWTYENVVDRTDKSAHGVVKDVNGCILFDNLNADPSYAREIMRVDDGIWRDLQAEANLTLAARAPVLLVACAEADALLVEILEADADNDHLVARCDVVRGVRALIAGAVGVK